MVMDESSRGIYGSMNGLKPGDQTFMESYNQYLIRRFEMDNTLVDRNNTCIPPLPPDLTPGNLELTSSISSDGDSHEECDFSDVALRQCVYNCIFVEQHFIFSFMH